MPVLPGAAFTARIQVATLDTFQPVTGVTVHLEQFNPAIGAFAPIDDTVTDSAGVASIPFSVPNLPGVYRYRASWRGTETQRPDASPQVRVKVVAAS